MGKLTLVPMKSIPKISYINKGNSCSDWVATEKVHGSSFQFCTDDGDTILMASRRNILKESGSFLKCNLREFKDRHENEVKRVFQAVLCGDRWAPYRRIQEEDLEEDDSDSEEKDQDNESNIPSEDDVLTSQTEAEVATTMGAGMLEKETTPRYLLQESSELHLRIYGELYGGGGVNQAIRGAVQKEIIYSDEFRFYVFGITINRRWVTVTEMNDLCRDAGFLYYASPVCAPMATVSELVAWLDDSGFMRSQSRMTESSNEARTRIEGVVITPLRRNDFGSHSVKYLAPAFVDVRISAGALKKHNYCTKARYLSVISKLDIPEREDTKLVVDMFIADILKESGQPYPSNKLERTWTKAARAWLVSDGYLKEDDDHERLDPLGDGDGAGARLGHAKGGNYSTPHKEEKSQSNLQTLGDGEDEEEDIGLGDVGGLFEL